MVGKYIGFMIRPLIFTPGFAVDEMDSTCIPALQDYLKELGRRKIRATIVSLNYPENSEYSWFGHNVFSLGWGNPGKLIKRMKLNHVPQELSGYLEGKTFDIVHSMWMTDASYMASVCATHLSLPHVITLMGQDVEPSWYSKRILKQKPEVVSISDFQLKRAKALCEIKKVIPWGIEKITCESGERTVDIVTIGWLNTTKQVHQTVELTRKLVHEFPELRVVLIGDGEMRHNIRNQIQKEGLDKHIKVAGLLERDEVLDYLAKSKVLFHPSAYEGFGMVLIEAQAMGAKVVSYPVGIAPELNDAVTVENFEEAVNAVRSQLTGSKESAARRDFKVEKTVDQYLELYQQMI